MTRLADDPLERERAAAHARGDGALYDAARRAQDAMVELAELLRRRGLRDVADVIPVQEMTSTAIGMAAAIFDELADQLAAQLARAELHRPDGRRLARRAPAEAVAALRQAARQCAQLAEATAVLPALADRLRNIGKRGTGA